MSFSFPQLFVWVVSAYLTLGFLFAILFAFWGAAKIDRHAAESTLGFRLLILPGATLLWPMLARRWCQAKGAPPEEKTAHRVAAGPSSSL